ncbi:hypothetical protein BLOT_002734 [Blomia tropicalis]|nr:hypothetical protein BLOT_002734 [Blomia tropicalis]
MTHVGLQSEPYSSNDFNVMTYGGLHFVMSTLYVTFTPAPPSNMHIGHLREDNTQNNPVN